MESEGFPVPSPPPPPGSRSGGGRGPLAAPLGPSPNSHSFPRRFSRRARGAVTSLPARRGGKGWREGGGESPPWRELGGVIRGGCRGGNTAGGRAPALLFPPGSR